VTGPTMDRAGTVVVTGVGLVLPTGPGRAGIEAVFAGRSAVRRLRLPAPGPFALATYPDAVETGRPPPHPGPGGRGGRAGSAGSGEWLAAPAVWFRPPPGTEGEDRAVQMALAAAEEAWRGGRLDRSAVPPDRVAVLVPLSKGGVFALAEAHTTGRGLALFGSRTEPRGAEGVPGRWSAGADPAAAGRAVARRFGLAGPRPAPVTACASGAHALVYGAKLVQRRAVDVALVGAAEASLHPLVLGCYRRMGVLADAADGAAAVRPFSATRRGFAVGEGAAVLVLESGASAKRRKVPSLAALRGWAIGAHAAGLANLDADGRTLARLLAEALRRANLEPRHVDLVYTHGTATRANDPAEAEAVRAVLGPAAGRVSLCATKAAHGHLLGAAAAVETALAVLAIRRGQVPPTLNLTDPDPAAAGLDLTPLVPRTRPLRHVVKTAAGFGGQTAVLVLAAPETDRRP